MFYAFLEDEIKEVSKEEWEETPRGIAIYDFKTWYQEIDVHSNFYISQPVDNIHFCKIENYSCYSFGTYHMPILRHHNKPLSFSFYLLPEKIIFIDDSEIVKERFLKLIQQKEHKDYLIGVFLYDFLNTLIDEDLLFLASIEKEITHMEEGILDGKMEDFNVKMLALKKEISKLYRYYTQLADLVECLFENRMNFFVKEEQEVFRIFADRAGRLQNETQVIREYAMQVQDVYQSEIGIRQNNVMKILTVVTTIFLPLSLIASWYGMNFTYMPELAWKYGYLGVATLCIIVIIVSLWIFKHKKFW